MNIRPEVTGRRFASDCEPEGYDAYSLAEFARRNSISLSGVYQALREGWGPETFFVGKRQLVSREAGDRWRRERERAARERISNDERDGDSAR